jgi:hypothetical protein
MKEIYVDKTMKIWKLYRYITIIISPAECSAVLDSKPFDFIAKYEDGVKYAYHHNKHIHSLYDRGWSVTYPKYWFHNAMKNFTGTTSAWAWV